MFPFILLGAAGAFLAYQLYREKTTKWVVNEISTKATTDKYRVRIEPDFHDGLITRSPKGIRVEIENLTDLDLIVDWANTLYITNGNTDGHFVFDGRQIAQQISAPRAPDVIFPKRTMVKTVKPASQVQEYNIPPIGRYAYTAGRHVHSPALKPGEHGVHLALRFEGQPMKETLVFTLDRVPVEDETPPGGLGATMESQV